MYFIVLLFVTLICFNGHSLKLNKTDTNAKVYTVTTSIGCYYVTLGSPVQRFCMTFDYIANNVVVLDALCGRKSVNKCPKYIEDRELIKL